MLLTDQILERVGLKFEDLTSAERETLQTWMNTLDSNQMTIETVKGFVRSMRDSVEREIIGIKETPQTWISILGLFIPFLAIIRKWYQDQYRISLEARLRNLSLLEGFLTSPEKAKESLDRALASIASTKK